MKKSLAILTMPEKLYEYIASFIKDEGIVFQTATLQDETNESSEKVLKETEFLILNTSIYYLKKRQEINFYEVS